MGIFGLLMWISMWISGKQVVQVVIGKIACRGCIVLEFLVEIGFCVGCGSFRLEDCGDWGGLGRLVLRGN